MLALHNIDEWRATRGRLPAGPLARYDRPGLVTAAMVILTMAAALFTLLALFDRMGWLWLQAGVAALGWNALGHLAKSLWRRRWLPGAASALGLVLPYTLLVMTCVNPATQVGWAGLVLAGGLLLPVTVLVTLVLSYGWLALGEAVRRWLAASSH